MGGPGGSKGGGDLVHGLEMERDEIWNKRIEVVVKG